LGIPALDVCKRDKRRITATEKKNTRTAGYNHLDYKRNLDMKELNTQPIMEFIEDYYPDDKGRKLL
jgi:hypothetical protein